jgi:hypothetical protein
MAIEQCASGSRKCQVRFAFAILVATIFMTLVMSINSWSNGERIDRLQESLDRLEQQINNESRG